MARKSKKKEEKEGMSVKVKAMLFGVFTLLAVFSAAVVAYQVLQDYKDRIAVTLEEDPMDRTIIAARDLHQGIEITEEDLVEVRVPPEFIPVGTEEQPLTVYTAAEHVVGRIPKERILANELIREGRLADPETGSGLNAVIPPGMRALSIAVTGDAALAGLLMPGNYVDVIVSLTNNQGDYKHSQMVMSTKTLLQAVYVLAVNSTVQTRSKTGRTRAKSTSRGSSVTLALHPQAALDLVHAASLGVITLSLRSAQDPILVELTNVEEWEVLGKEEEKPEEPKPKVKPKPRPPKVVEEKKPALQIWRGSN